ncbi:MAG: hypothetical protein RBT74_09895 [Tenuifilaceae bacterium]|jgi:hypothetical protein|nr:hypothetical protein [Tenuifilaceae bacterium]
MKFQLCLIITVLSTLYSLKSFSHKGFIRIEQIAYGFNFSSSWSQSQPLGVNIDFTNYIHSSKIDNGASLGFGSTFGIGNTIKVDARASYSPDTRLNMKGQIAFFTGKYFGLVGGYATYSNTVNNYRDFFENQSDEYILLANSYLCFEGIQFSNRAIYLGPTMRYSMGIISIEGSVALGYAQNSNFSTTIAQKKVDSNYRKEMAYDIVTSSYLVVMPEVKFNADIFSFDITTFGFEVSVFGEFSKRSLNYNLTESSWTNTQPTSQKVENPKRLTSRLNVDVSIIWKF